MPVKTSGKIIFLFVLVVRSYDRGWENEAFWSEW
jgi:hypothetical protein